MRKLVSIRTIGELRPIEGADAIECALVDGWTVVTKKGEFKAGDPCMYFEIDSFLPESDERFAFLMKGGVRTMDGVRGHRLRTVKLRGQLSQGLVLPLIIDYPGGLPYGIGCIRNASGEEHFVNVGDDVTDFLGIKKWEAPIPAQLAGQVKGAFPGFIRKTDQERCQNLRKEIFVDNADATYEITMKLDGTSCTFYHRDGELGVCSRNFELKLNEENKDNTLVKLFNESGLREILPQLGNVALQGEVMGEGIQGNREQIKGHEFFLFDAQNLDTGRYFTPDERHSLFAKLRYKTQKIQHVPTLQDCTLAQAGITNIEQLLKFAEGPSLNHPVREGLVFKRDDGGFSFKAISNAFLLKEKD